MLVRIADLTGSIVVDWDFTCVSLCFADMGSVGALE
jgi:hypothetical protein